MGRGESAQGAASSWTPGPQSCVLVHLLACATAGGTTGPERVKGGDSSWHKQALTKCYFLSVV